MNQFRLLIVDNEERMCQVLKAAFESEKYMVDMAFDGASAIKMNKREPYDIVIADLKMPGLSGMDVLESVKNENPGTEVILMTAYATAQTAVEAMKKGAYDYLIKPFEMDELQLKIAHIIEKHRLAEENKYLRKELHDKFSLDNVIGQSDAMQHIYKMANKVANSDATVLILGQSGTGKELIARSIHEMSDRSEQPFVAVNCAALPEGLLESELFGHEKGAFTGAHKMKPGRFEIAGQGTVFLDEIGDLTPATQVKLLRVLQTHEIERVGGNKTIAVQARIIAATNRDLEKALQDGSFREDLYYRINVFPIILPPLRNRPEDIPELITHFLKKHGGAKTEIEPDALACLLHYQWPGNVRELENVIERAIIMAGGGVLRKEDLPMHITSFKSVGKASAEQDEKEMRIDEVERDLILTALKKTAGNKSNAAQLLGITRRKLYSMMERLEIS